MAEMTEQERMRRWVETWKQAGPELQRIKEEELRARSDEQLARDSEAALLLADHWLALHPGYERESGMIEQQRLFRKWTPPRI
ncbi:MAG TPA: hypothetical protein VIS74_07410 [Chthoniobacterales bacterium]